MMNSIGPRYRKIAAVSALLFLFYLAFQLMVSPVAAMFAARSDRISELELRTERLRNIETRLTQIGPILESEVRRGDGKGLMLRAESDDLASANLQGRLRSLVTTSGATLRSIRSLTPAVNGDGPVPVGAKLSIIGGLESIQETIYRIETAVPHLFIDKITLKPTRRQGEGAQISLDVDLDLSGYRLDEAS